MKDISVRAFAARHTCALLCLLVLALCALVKSGNASRKHFIGNKNGNLAIDPASGAKVLFNGTDIMSLVAAQQQQLAEQNEQLAQQNGITTNILSTLEELRNNVTMHERTIAVLTALTSTQANLLAVQQRVVENLNASLLSVLQTGANDDASTGSTDSGPCGLTSPDPPEGRNSYYNHVGNFMYNYRNFQSTERTRESTASIFTISKCKGQNIANIMKGSELDASFRKENIYLSPTQLTGWWVGLGAKCPEGFRSKLAFTTLSHPSSNAFYKRRMYTCVPR